MAEPAHRWQPPGKPRLTVVIVPRSAFFSAAWYLAGSWLADLNDWTGSWIFTPFSATARTMALAYLVVALLQWRHHARR